MLRCWAQLGSRERQTCVRRLLACLPACCAACCAGLLLACLLCVHPSSGSDRLAPCIPAQRQTCVQAAQCIPAQRQTCVQAAHCVEFCEIPRNSEQRLACLWWWAPPASRLDSLLAPACVACIRACLRACLLGNCRELHLGCCESLGNRWGLHMGKGEGTWVGVVQVEHHLLSTGAQGREQGTVGATGGWDWSQITCKRHPSHLPAQRSRRPSVELIEGAENAEILLRMAGVYIQGAENLLGKAVLCIQDAGHLLGMAGCPAQRGDPAYPRGSRLPRSLGRYSRRGGAV
eukprot:gene21337-biopygen8639